MFKETLTKKIIDHAMEIVVVFDSSGEIIYGNRKSHELLGYEDSLKGHFIREIFPNDLDEDFSEIEKLIDDQAKSMMAYRHNRTCFAVEAQFMEYENDLYICMANDSSKQNYYEKMANQSGQEAEAALQVKTQFVANVTHELRTPVNGILGNTRELINLETDESKIRLLKLVERGCNDMHSIINNILDFSKLDAGKFDLEKREFNFRSMMDYIKSTHISKITEKGLKFFITISPEIPENIIGDELRIQQVLNNLLSNAVKFTLAGRIAVEVVKTAQIDDRIELFFMVIDTGIGIAKEDQDKLFKSFSQVEASTTRKFGGTGLGLSISKQIVELMGGSIHVESEKNRGTMFSFHIWVDVKKEELLKQNSNNEGYVSPFDNFDKIMQQESELYNFGSEENRAELNKKMTKLVLCVEMENWDKAEDFMESIKALTAEAPREIKSPILRLKMAVQKADRDKAVEAFEVVKAALEQ